MEGGVDGRLCDETNENDVSLDDALRDKGDRGGSETVSPVIKDALSAGARTSDGGRDRRMDGAGDRFANGSSSRRSAGGESVGGAGRSSSGRSGSEDMLPCPRVVGAAAECERARDV